MNLHRTSPANGSLKITFINCNKRFFLFIIVLTAISLVSFTNDGKKITNSAHNSTETAYYFNVNKIAMPLNNNGVLADVVVPGYTSGAKYDDKIFLFSGGFFLGGYGGYESNFLWVNGNASAARIGDYQAGKVGMNPSDPKAKLYILKSSDAPFGTSWNEWKTAVELGAEFYDGDGDGVYNPIDKNKNGIWDSNEDRPGLIGDETAWCVYNDGVPADQRRFPDVNPLGIEIHQTVFVYRNVESLSNTIFVKYKLINTGRITSKLDSVIFSFWTDPDIGHYNDDRVGCDTILSTGFAYNNGFDAEFGYNPPALFTQIIQGPQAYIPGTTFIDANGNGKFDEGDTPLESAKLFLSEISQQKTVAGAKNLKSSSFIYTICAHPRLGEPSTPSEFYHFLNGRNRIGEYLNPCTWRYGVIMGGVDCSKVNPKFVYSGDPEKKIGWIAIDSCDVRMFTNVGRFQLIENKPVEIIAAYTVGRGENDVNSVTVGKKYAALNYGFMNGGLQKAAKLIETELKFRTTENRIDVIWGTAEDFRYKDFLKSDFGDTVRNLQFEAYELWMHRTPSLELYRSGQINSVKIAAFDVKNKIDNLFIQSDPVLRDRLFEKGIQLDETIYSNPATGRILFTITNDPFNNDKPIVKGKTYYFSLKKIAVNKAFISLVDSKVNSWLLSGPRFSLFNTNDQKIHSASPGQDLNSPYTFETIAKSSGASESKVWFEEIDKDKITGDDYEISFIKNRYDSLYSMLWRFKNVSRDSVLLDSQKYYRDKHIFTSAEGLAPHIEWIEPKVKDAIYSSVTDPWYRPAVKEVSGNFYMGRDISSQIINSLGYTGSLKSSLIKYDNLRQVEIRFGKKQRAYRYVSNSLGTAYQSAGGASSVGKPGEYFVEVPFQIWVKDSRFKEEQQLACGFLERLIGSGAKPDGIWDPGINIADSKEYIIIFNSSYDSTGKQLEYVGYIPVTGTKTWANLRGWTPPLEAGFTAEQTARAKSPWFDALYVVGLERKSLDQFYTDGDVYTIPISYVLTERDTFYYKSKSKSDALTTDERKKMIERINVYPNPYFEWENPRDYLPMYQSFITFSNLPEEVTIKIYSLSGIHVRTLNETNKQNIASPFLNWDLKNESGNKASSGMYIAWVSSKYGEKVLKFAIVNQRKY
jgi:hypothetical protein